MAALRHLASGYGPPSGKCIPCSGVSGRAGNRTSCSSFSNHRSHSRVSFAFNRASFSCAASSSGHRRNPDFSRHSKYGFSRSRNNKQMEDRDSFENQDESDMLSSKNGPLLSFSSSSKSQATAVPGPREKEIVELFRKVQAQLRERAALREESKAEARRGKGKEKESETVDSLLKLLRKHSVEQGKRKNTARGSKETNLEQSEQSFLSFEEKGQTVFDSNNILGDEPEPPVSPSFNRPPSNFRRKSPVPRVKYQQVNFSDVNASSVSQTDLNSLGETAEAQSRSQPEYDPKVEPEPELEPEPKLEPEPEPEPELEDDAQVNSQVLEDGDYEDILNGELSDNDAVDDGESNDKPDTIEDRDLSALKLQELRAMAKSRGIKGFSKMKKGDLLQLLSGD